MARKEAVTLSPSQGTGGSIPSAPTMQVFRRNNYVYINATDKPLHEALGLNYTEHELSLADKIDENRGLLKNPVKTIKTEDGSMVFNGSTTGS